MHSFIFWLARLFARLGGFALVALILLTCLSIAGRSLNGILHADWLQSIAPGLTSGMLALGIGPINGDFELVEAGMAFAIFSFLPLCQLQGAHASVDIFTSALPMRASRILRMVVEVVFAAAIILIAWKLFEGMQSKLRSGQTTLLLQYPVWWGYAVSLLGAVVAAIVSVYVASMRLVEAMTGKSVLPAEMEADH